MLQDNELPILVTDLVYLTNKVLAALINLYLFMVYLIMLSVAQTVCNSCISLVYSGVNVLKYGLYLTCAQCDTPSDLWIP